MLLQQRRGHLIGHGALDHPLNDIGLVLAPRHQDDLLGAHYRIQPHRNAHLGGVLQTEESARLQLARIVRELHQTGARLGVGAGLVEADLPLLAHADHDQVDLADHLVVGGAILRHAVEGDRTVGDMDILGQNVDLIEELLVNPVVAALLLGLADRIELVETKHGHVGEADFAPLVTLHQFVVETQRRAARRKTQRKGDVLLVDLVRTVGLVVVANHLDDGVGHVLYSFILTLIHQRVHFLVTMNDVARCGGRDQSAILRQRILVVFHIILKIERS